MKEPWTLARTEHEKHVLFADGCPYCMRRLEESAEDTSQQIMNYCTIHGEVNCKEVSCFVCGNHALDPDGRCTDPKCHSATRVLIRRLPGATMPTRAYDGDAGLDLYAFDNYEIMPGAFVDVTLGLLMALPAGYFGRITGRSSGFRKRGFVVIEGVIDAGYRGPLYAGVWNAQGMGTIVVRTGEKIAQMLIHRVERLVPTPVDVLPASERGERGFGSSDG